MVNVKVKFPVMPRVYSRSSYCRTVLTTLYISWHPVSQLLAFVGVHRVRANTLLRSHYIRTNETNQLIRKHVQFETTSSEHMVEFHCFQVLFGSFLMLYMLIFIQFRRIATSNKTQKEMGFSMKIYEDLGNGKSKKRGHVC